MINIDALWPVDGMGIRNRERTSYEYRMPGFLARYDGRTSLSPSFVSELLLIIVMVGLVKVMWSIYGLGFVLIPRQVKHETQMRNYKAGVGPVANEKPLQKSSSDVPLTA